MRANCDETHELMYDYTKHVVQEMAQIEEKEYEVRGKRISFQCKLVPSDQKWMASMTGEPNNAATFFSTFANVTKGTMMSIRGSIGGDGKSTWKPWTHEQRVKDAKEVAAFKRRNKLPPDCKDKKDRSKVTTFIATRKSGQEHEPPIVG